MKRKLLAFFAISAICLALIQPFLVKLVKATDSDTVQATVTAVVYAVSITDGSIAFLTVPTTDTKDTTTGVKGVDDSQTAHNDGSVASKFSIKSTTTGGTAPHWTLASSAGSEQYTLKSCITTCDASPTWTSVGIDPSYATLAASIDAGNDQIFDLQVGTPTVTTATDQKTITVTVLAEAP